MRPLDAQRADSQFEIQHALRDPIVHFLDDGAQRESQTPTLSHILVQFGSVDEPVSNEQICLFSGSFGVHKAIFDIFQNRQVSEPNVAHNIFAKSWNKTHASKCNTKMLTD